MAQVQRRLESEVDTPLLLCGEVAVVVAEPRGIHRASLLDEDARRCAVDRLASRHAGCLELSEGSTGVFVEAYGDHITPAPSASRTV